MIECIEFLKLNHLFRGIKDEELTQYILPHGKVYEYGANSILFFPQDKVNHILILMSGKVKQVYYRSDGIQDIQNMILPPNIIGVDLICTKTRLAPYEACAVNDSKVFSLPVELFLIPGTLPCGLQVTCLKNLLTVISHANIKNEYRTAILTHNSLRERILVYLTLQANKRQTDSFRIPFNRDELASYLSVNRSALSHELSLMKQEGLIDFKKNHFTLLIWKPARQM